MKKIALLFLVFLASFGLSLPPLFSQVKPVKLRVGMSPIVDYQALFATVDQGFFREQNLDVEMVSLAGGTEKLMATAGGSLEIAGSSLVPLLSARDKGFDFLILGGAWFEPDKEPFTNYLIARKDSGIKRWRDLEGKKVAVNTRRQISDLYIIEVVRRDGGDPSKIVWIELGFAVAGGALLNKQVDAAALIEPFASPLKDHPEMNNLGSYFHPLRPGAMVGFYAATKRWVDANPEPAAAFVRAMDKGAEWINSRPREGRQLLLKYTRMKPEVLEKFALKVFGRKVDLGELDWTSDLAFRLGWLNKKPNAEEFVYKTGR